jgi:hypothetical protein
VGNIIWNISLILGQHKKLNQKLRKVLDIQRSVWYNPSFDANFDFRLELGGKRGGIYSSKTLCRVFHSYFVIEDDFVSPHGGALFMPALLVS